MNWPISLIARAPGIAVGAGKAVFLLGAVLIVAAVFGRAQMIGINAERAKANLAPLARLAEAYPQYPTWMIPEGPVGYTVAAVLVLAGMFLVVRGGEARKKPRPR